MSTFQRNISLSKTNVHTHRHIHTRTHMDKFLISYIHIRLPNSTSFLLWIYSVRHIPNIFSFISLSHMHLVFPTQYFHLLFLLDLHFLCLSFSNPLSCSMITFYFALPLSPFFAISFYLSPFLFFHLVCLLFYFFSSPSRVTFLFVYPNRYSHSLTDILYIFWSSDNISRINKRKDELCRYVFFNNSSLVRKSP